MYNINICSSGIVSESNFVLTTGFKSALLPPLWSPCVTAGSWSCSFRWCRCSSWHTSELYFSSSQPNTTWRIRPSVTRSHARWRCSTQPGSCCCSPSSVTCRWRRRFDSCRWLVFFWQWFSNDILSIFILLIINIYILQSLTLNYKTTLT